MEQAPSHAQPESTTHAASSCEPRTITDRTREASELDLELVIGTDARARSSALSALTMEGRQVAAT